jgi:hypothetical protein
MTPRNHSVRKLRRPDQQRLSVRSTLLLDLSARVGLADAVLMYAAHQPRPLIAISAVAASVASYTFLNNQVEDDQVELAVDLFYGGGSRLFALLLLELCQHCGLGGFVVHSGADHGA